MAANSVLTASRTSLDPLFVRPVIGNRQEIDAGPSASSFRPAVAASRVHRPQLDRTRVNAVAQYMRFCVVGLSNALVDLGVLNALLLAYPTRGPLPLLLDNTLAVSLAILNSWIWNSRWTFRAQVTRRPRQRALFVAQALLNVAANNLVLLGMTEVLPASHGLSAQIASNLAKLAGMMAASSISFLLLRSLVFVPALGKTSSVLRAAPGRGRDTRTCA